MHRAFAGKLRELPAGVFGGDFPVDSSGHRTMALRIVALAAEAVDILHHLKALDQVVGASRHAPLPPGASIPRVGGFATPDLRKILSLSPDLVVLTSDVQADAARELARAGVPLLHLNPHRLEDLFTHIRWLGGLVGRMEEAEALIRKLRDLLERHRGVCPPLRVFVEEWPDPLIVASGWVTDLVTWVGGVNVFPELRGRFRAQDRVVSPEAVVARDPEVILYAWCGRPGRDELIAGRPGWDGITAVRTRRIHELPSDWFLQVGPSLILRGLPLLVRLLCEEIPSD